MRCGVASEAEGGNYNDYLFLRFDVGVGSTSCFNEVCYK